jgi:hypothetical protein
VQFWSVRQATHRLAGEQYGLADPQSPPVLHWTQRFVWVLQWGALARPEHWVSLTHCTQALALQMRPLTQFVVVRHATHVLAGPQWGVGAAHCPSDVHGVPASAPPLEPEDASPSGPGDASPLDPDEADDEEPPLEADEDDADPEDEPVLELPLLDGAESVLSAASL